MQNCYEGPFESLVRTPPSDLKPMNFVVDDLIVWHRMDGEVDHKNNSDEDPDW